MLGKFFKFSDTLWGPSPFHINVINFDCYCLGPLSEGVALALNTDIWIFFFFFFNNNNNNPRHFWHFLKIHLLRQVVFLGSSGTEKEPNPGSPNRVQAYVRQWLIAAYINQAHYSQHNFRAAHLVSAAPHRAETPPTRTPPPPRGSYSTVAHIPHPANSGLPDTSARCLD